MKKKMTAFVIFSLFLCAVGYAEYVHECTPPCMPTSQDMIAGKSYWTYDASSRVWSLNHGTMGKHDTLRVTVPVTVFRDTLAEGYYPAIILIPETP